MQKTFAASLVTAAGEKKSGGARESRFLPMSHCYSNYRAINVTFSSDVTMMEKYDSFYCAVHILVHAYNFRFFFLNLENFFHSIFPVKREIKNQIVSRYLSEFRRCSTRHTLEREKYHVYRM